MSTLVYPTMLDIAKFNGNDSAVALVEEVITEVPELGLMAARTIPGTQYKTLVRTALPVVGFRNAGEGAVQGKSAYAQRMFECFIMNPRWNADKAVADAHPDGAEALIAMEGVGQTAAAGIAVASQFYYGTGTDAKGFPGLANYVDSTLVIDATGSTASTGSSVWAMKFGPMDVQLVMGGEGTFSLSDVRVGDVLDTNGNPFTAYIQELMSWLGLQVLSRWSVGRIKNLTAQAGKGLTDSLLADLIGAFPVGKRPDALLMSRRSLTQLQKSRTATNVTGAPAPTPTEYQGIPIVPTEAIVNTEAIT
jgi:hypothetical protein